MDFDAAQVQRIASWDTSGAGQLADGVLVYGLLTALALACHSVARSRARLLSSYCTTRSQQLKQLVRSCTSPPFFAS